ncbi:MAG: O-antigen ligase family protein [Patescibacteria group bacterium]|nr:O-antigen ligase family protein [Patescibacteria group bacterium]
MKIVNKEQWLAKVGLCLILFTPLLVSSSFIFPYIGFKNFVFRALVLIVFLLALAWGLRAQEGIRKKNYIFGAWLVFVLVQALASIFGVNFYNSFWGNYERMDGLSHFLFLTLYFWTLLMILKEKSAWLWFWRAGLIAANLIALFTLFYRWGVRADFFNNASTVGNTVFLGSYLMINIFLALILYYWDRQRKWQMFYLASAALFLIVLLANASRGSILGLLAGGFLAALVYSFQASKKFKQIFYTASVLILVLGGLAFWQKDSPLVSNIFFLNRLTTISREDSSANNRLLTWEVTWQAAQDRPILGYGPENISYGINKHFNPDITEQWFDRAHSFIFDYLGSSGFLGLAAYLGVFLTAGVLIWKRRKEEYGLAALSLGLLTAYLVSNLFAFDTLNSWVLLIPFLAFAYFLWPSANSDNCRWPNFLAKNYYIVLSLMMVLAVLTTYSVIIRPARASILGIEAIKNYNVDPVKTLGYYRQSLDMNTYGNVEIAHQLARYTLQVLEHPDFDLQFQNEIFEETEKRLKDILAKDPRELRTRFFLVQTYQAYARFNTFYIQESIDILEEVADLYPMRVEIYNLLGQSYFLKNDFGKSLEYLEKILSLTQNRQEDYFNVINISARIKNIDKMNYYIAEMEARLGPLSSEDYRRLGQYYFMADQEESAEAILLNRAIPLDPLNIRAHISLASIYEFRGDYQRAIDYVSDLLIEHPDWIDTLGDYVRHLEELKEGS